MLFYQLIQHLTFINILLLEPSLDRTLLILSKGVFIDTRIAFIYQN